MRSRLLCGALKLLTADHAVIKSMRTLRDEAAARLRRRLAQNPGGGLVTMFRCVAMSIP